MEKELLKLEQGNYSNTDENCLDDEFKGVSFSLVYPNNSTDVNRIRVQEGLSEIEQQLSLINQQVNELNADIDKLTNHADGLDYTVAVVSGIIAGLIDSFWVGEFSLDRANDWGNEKTNNFVIKIAQKQGYQGDDLAGAIQFLEEKFPIVADKSTNDFGGGLQHHLRDFSHHPTPIGLMFSLLTQFTNKVYGTDVAGIFKVVDVKKADLILIGKNIPEKITFGVVNWFFHIVSDIAGSSSSVIEGKLGTGLPGPIVSLLKELSALPIFKNMNKNGYKEFSVWISKLFNGTLLGKKDENGKIIEAVKFDFRTEIGIAHELGRQAVPVVVNECIVRGFYFIRRLCLEIKNNEIKSFSDLKNINWKNTLPFKNRTIVRMLTIATGTFTAVDMADAGIRAVIKSGGFNAATLGNFVLNVNFVGVGRFAIAVATDVGMGVKKGIKENKRLDLMSEQLQLMNVKVSYKQADMWISAKDAGTSITEAYQMVTPAVQTIVTNWVETDKNVDAIVEAIEKENEDDAMIDAFLNMYDED